MTSSVAIAFEQFALEKTRLLKLETLRAKNLTKALLNGTGGNRQWRVSPDTELPEDFYTLAIQLGW